MGYEKIAKHRKELKEKIKTFEALAAAAKPLNERLQKIAAARKQLDEQYDKTHDVVQKLAKDIEKIDTKGVKEFEDFLKSLQAILRSNVDGRPLPTKPMEEALARMRKDVEVEHRKWIEKLASNMPKELKPGMVLIDKAIGSEYEIKGPATVPGAPPGGDAGTFYTVICHRDGKQTEMKMSVQELKRNGMKFVRS